MDQATGFYSSPSANRMAMLTELSPADKMIRIYGFTPAEAEFTKLLIAGHSVAECAEELSVSIHTARSHLKKAMAKTQTNRQGALIGKLLRD